MGQAPTDAARSAIRELTPALIGSTLTPIVVFVPLVFLGGITAVFFRALAMTLVTALLGLAVPGDLLHAGAGAASSCGPPRDPATTDLEEAEQAGEGRLLRWLSGRYERGPALVPRPQPDRPGGGRPDPGRLRRHLPAARQRLPAPRWTKAPSSSTTSCPPGTSLAGDQPRAAATSRRFLRETPEVESYSRRTGARLGPGHRRAEHRRLPGQAEARPQAFPRRGHRASCAARSTRRAARHRRRVPAHPGGPDRRPRLVASADRDQGLPRRPGRLRPRWPTRSRNGCPR